MGNPIAKKGFTLVELAIVLVIVGLLVGLGSGMVGPLVNAIKIRESKENIGAAVESINSWASGNNSLPSAAGFSGAVRSPQDAWGRDFIYLFDTSLYSATPTKDTICGRRSTQTTLVTTDPSATIPNIAYAIISPGDNATLETTLAGNLNGAASGPAIAAGTRGFITGMLTVDAQNSDIVRWVTLDELRTKVGCQGAQLKIVNNELPVATVASLYPGATGNVAFATDGGAAPLTLRWCVETSTAAAPLPDGLNFAPLLTDAIRVAPNTCNGSSPLAETGWVTSATLAISGTPSAGTQGAYSFVLYVRDDNDTSGSNDNVASKSFVLTVNP